MVVNKRRKREKREKINAGKYKTRKHHFKDEDTDTRIKPDDVIMSSRGKIEILNQDKTKEATYKRISSAAKKVIEGNPYVREERKKKEAANSKKKMRTNEKSEKRKRQKVDGMDEKHEDKGADTR